MKAVKYMRYICILSLCFLLVACGSEESSDYPSDYPKSDPQTREQVLLPSHPEALVLSDGAVAMIDYSNTSQGYIQARLLAPSQTKIKLQVMKDDKKYSYDLTNTEYDTFPLQMGNGIYTFKILQNLEADNYAVIASVDVEVSIENDLLPYLYPNQYVAYNIDDKVVDLSFKLTKGDKDDLTRIYHLYKYVVETLSYDKEKAKAVENQFVIPVLDETLELKTGICFDYASLLGALCRIQGIPTRLIFGDTDIEYHAWVEIYLENEGWINPKVYFEKNDWSRADPTFASSGQDYEGRYDEIYHY